MKLIDIAKLGLVDAFLSLDFDLHTTDFVFAGAASPNYRRQNKRWRCKK